MKNLLFTCCALFFLISCKTEEPRQIGQYTIDQFYKNTRYSGGQFSPDETRLLVNSDESGIFNLYEINLADGTRNAVTQSVIESFFAVDYVPGSDAIIYSADKGGNEIDHLYLLEKGIARDLTPGEKEKARWRHRAFSF